ncbi:hypothetical protein [Micromonospora sp. B9E7]
MDALDLTPALLLMAAFCLLVTASPLLARTTTPSRPTPATTP